MKLVDLDPRWLMKQGRRVGLVFRCPHCADKPLGGGTGKGCYLSCFFEAVPHICGDTDDAQYYLIAQVLPEEHVANTVPCRKGIAWKATPSAPEATFENLTIKPSLDASAAGHWHGFVTNGAIA